MRTQAPQLEDIRRSVGVLLAGVVAGVLLIAALAYLYGPTGRLAAHKAMLSPESLTRGAMTDTGPGSRSAIRYVWDRTEFNYFDEAQHSWVTRKVPLDRYTQVWELVADDVSMRQVDPGIEALFRQAYTPRLIVWYRSTDGSAPPKSLMEIFIAPHGDYYRILLVNGEWAYFHHPAIQDEVLTLLQAPS